MNRTLISATLAAAAALALAGTATANEATNVGTEMKPLTADVSPISLVKTAANIEANEGHVHAAAGPCGCQNCAAAYEMAKWNGNIVIGNVQAGETERHFSLGDNDVLLAYDHGSTQGLAAALIVKDANVGDVTIQVAVAAQKATFGTGIETAAKNGAFNDGTYLAGGTTYRDGATERPQLAMGNVYA